MSYTCEHCEQDTQEARSVPAYGNIPDDDGWEILCETCHADWLLSLRG